MEDPGLIVGQEAKILLFAMIVRGLDGARWGPFHQNCAAAAAEAANPK